MTQILEFLCLNGADGINNKRGSEPIPEEVHVLYETTATSSVKGVGKYKAGEMVCS